MRLLYYIIRQYLHCIKYHQPFSTSNINRGIKLWHNTQDTKNIFRVCHELSRLSSYWKTFPDTYFRFNMFQKDYTDKKKMYSFIPQGAYYRYAVPRDTQYNLLIDDKIIFHDIMNYYGFPVPYRYFTFRNNLFRISEYAKDILLTDQEVDTIIGNIDDDIVFAKSFTGGAASGVSVFKRNSQGKLCNEEGSEVSSSMIRNVYKDKDIFLEKQIKQESVLSAFNPDTVNTIRVLTYNNKVVSASVRFGRKNQFVDNTAKGGIAVDLDIDTSCLGQFGQREYDINKYYEHPDSHLKFSNVFVPQWREAKELVEDVCKVLPYYKSVGFDIATTDNGPVIIEINNGSGVYVSQMGKEYGIADKFLN